MRVVVTGSRNYQRPTLIKHRLHQLAREHGPCLVIVGDARGVDATAAMYAKALGHEVAVYRADWEKHGRSAGAIRNRVMLDQNPSLVIAFWDGESRGTRDCFTEAKRRNIPVELHEVAA